MLKVPRLCALQKWTAYPCAVKWSFSAKHIGLVVFRVICRCSCCRRKSRGLRARPAANEEEAAACVGGECFGRRPTAAFFDNKCNRRDTSSSSAEESVQCMTASESDASHVTEEDLPDQGPPLAARQRRPKRHVYRENGVEISWLSPRCSPHGHCRPGEREQQEAQHSSEAAKEWRSDVVPAAAAQSHHYVRRGSAAAFTANSTQQDLAESTAANTPGLIQRELPPNSLSILKDIFLCLRAALRESHEQQQKLCRRQRRLERWLQQQLRFAEESKKQAAAQQPGVSKGAKGVVAREAGCASKRYSSRVYAQCGRNLGAIAAASPGAKNATSHDSELPPIPPHPWHVGGPPTAARIAASAAAGDPGLQDFWWRGRKQPTNPSAGRTQPQQHRPRRIRSPVRASWGPGNTQGRRLMLPPLAPATEADVEKVMLRARQKFRAAGEGA